MDEVTLLSLLLKDPQERNLLKKSLVDFRAKHELSDSVHNFVRQLDQDQLKTQAEGLLKKRLHGIKPYAPQTLSSLGDQAWELFQDWAVSSWAEGHRRHLIDANNFLAHLKKNRFSIDPKEYNQTCFLIHKKRLSIHLLRPSPFTGLGLHIIWRYKQGFCDRWWYLSIRPSKID